MSLKAAFVKIAAFVGFIVQIKKWYERNTLCHSLSFFR
ncbi:hypothetical protein C942_01845 [Photobacterium marinum]|uniref:Uncharacterized protein n=1 Tax=Photobacterium marinum TaxID=1056511 RepID=L8JAP3_9GAMM|nr:hypothetical protein C942_01845 [Photobacterium marinum]